ncbi:MAG TPA: hypothetical protein VN517_12865 [Terriglobales bacterium]|nr:hypothetical protein [Terriglobales bacterium]
MRKSSRSSRSIAILEVYVVFGIIIAVVLVLAGPHIVSQGT